MEWLFILGLIGWVWWQSQRITKLERRLVELEREAQVTRASAPAPRVPPSPPWITPAPPQAVDTPPPAPAANEDDVLVLDQPIAPDELVLDTPAPADEREPLLLDTPLPPVSNDDGSAAPPVAPPLAEPPHAEPARAAAPRKRVANDRRLENWLAQNGLAWLGGATMVIAVIAMVMFASQQGWFTPTVRLGCAIALGLALIAASELARRVGLRRPPGHPLVAAMLAGAGAATFYITTWAAHDLYQFAGWEITAALLLVCALILYGLSRLHGQALGVLAVLGALLAPALASSAVWPSAALTMFVCAVGVAGFALAWFRRWAWVAAATLLGLYFWFAAALSEDEVRRALALISFASLGGFMASTRAPLATEPVGRLTWSRAQSLLPAVAISISSVILLGAWLSLAPSPTGSIAGTAAIGVFHVALAALAVRARAAHPAVLTVAITFLVLGFMSYMRSRFYFGPLNWDFYASLLTASPAIALCALGARPHRTGRLLVAGAGAIGAALLALLAASSRENWHDLTAWLPLFTIGAVLFAFAWRTARDAPKPDSDGAVDFWAGAGAALFLVGIESAFPDAARAVADAGAALLFAGGLTWQGWRALRYAPLTAAVLAIGHAMSPTLLGPVLTGDIPLWGGLLALALTAALLYGAAHFASRAEARTPSEALTSAAVIVLLVGAYLTLRWLANGGAGAPLEPFSETALHALTLIAAGYVLLPRRADDGGGPIAKWRGHVLMGLGLLIILLLPALVTNPWWGSDWRVDVIGPPIFNTLLLAFAAPAALTLAAAARLYDFQRPFARIYAAAGGLLALLWAVLEIRRLFNGAEMDTAPVGLFEGACYALTFLASALAVAVVGRMRAARHADGPFTHDLVLITRACAWAGIVSCGAIMLLLRHPAWGVHDASVTGAVGTAMATLAQAVGVVLALYLGRALSRANQPLSTRFAAACLAVLLAWSFGHAAIRWLYHGGDMDYATGLAGIEGFAHALWPLALVLVGAHLTARAPGRDTIRAYLYDLQAIWSVAVWPALIFTALGFWVIHNPWWGLAPAAISGPVSAAAALLTLVLGAGLSALAMRVPKIQQAAWFAPIARVVCVGHLFVALTLTVRYAFHGAAMSGATWIGAEMCALSAAWAVFGGAALTLGGARNDSVLRWCGLIILFATAGKVLAVDTVQLDILVRVGSAFVVAVVLLSSAWLARRQAAQKEEPLTLTTPAGEREKPRDPQ